MAETESEGKSERNRGAVLALVIRWDCRRKARVRRKRIKKIPGKKKGGSKGVRCSKI